MKLDVIQTNIQQDGAQEQQHQKKCKKTHTN